MVSIIIWFFLAFFFGWLFSRSFLVLVVWPRHGGDAGLLWGSYCSDGLLKATTVIDGCTLIWMAAHLLVLLVILVIVELSWRKWPAFREADTLCLGFLDDKKKTKTCKRNLIMICVIQIICQFLQNSFALPLFFQPKQILLLSFTATYFLQEHGFTFWSIMYLLSIHQGQNHHGSLTGHSSA